MRTGRALRVLMEHQGLRSGVEALSLAGGVSAELDGRIRARLGSWTGPTVTSSGALRRLRAIHALERLASEEAREELRRLAREGATERERREAEASLKRLGPR